MFEVSDEETVEGVAALSEEPAADAEDVVDSVIEKMCTIENHFWSESIKRIHPETLYVGPHTGEEGDKTAEKIGVPGAWDIGRRENGLWTGAVFVEKSEFAGQSIIDDDGRAAIHAAICQHGTLKGARIRSKSKPTDSRGAVEWCSRSPQWCEECAKIVPLDNQEEE